MAAEQTEVAFQQGVKRTLRSRYGDIGFRIIMHTLTAFSRILPHVEVTRWRKIEELKESDAVWADKNTRAKLRVVVSRNTSLGLAAELERRTLLTGRKFRRALRLNEIAICKCIISVFDEMWPEVSRNLTASRSEVFLQTFDQAVIVEYYKLRHGFSPSDLFASLRALSERSYESKSIPFGVVVDTKQSIDPKWQNKTLANCLGDKRFQALTDGYHTAYLVDKNGIVSDIFDLSRDSDSRGGGKYFPEWSRPMASTCVGQWIGFSLTRQGDILCFDSGTLRITYRGGRWQYWNHDHVVTIMLHASRSQHVVPNKRKRILRRIYRRALDLSFRRTGGLYVLLRDQTDLHKIVRKGDAIGDRRRGLMSVLDNAFKKTFILGVPQRVLNDLASLDGAVVLTNSGQLKAFGAVLHPKKSGRVQQGGQGSRTKAAIGASHYGLSTKISSDGEISFFKEGDEILSI